MRLQEPCFDGYAQFFQAAPGRGEEEGEGEGEGEGELIRRQSSFLCRPSPASYATRLTFAFISSISSPTLPFAASTPGAVWQGGIRREGARLQPLFAFLFRKNTFPFQQHVIVSRGVFSFDVANLGIRRVLLTLPIL